MPSPAPCRRQGAGASPHPHPTDALPRTGHGSRTRPRLRRDTHRPPRQHAPAWIDAVDASQLPGLAGFALHLLRDLDAVTAGLTLDRSSGSIEGAVNRIKKIKRQLYGRAGFELLHKMILPQ
ncbi:transposase [Streptomyces sp. NPDC041003]|uniref:transposase n=1 Tax=Streptomyces sp. NPDC041003 TaxID=3155730 RepID=UPI003407D38A